MERTLSRWELTSPAGAASRSKNHLPRPTLPYKFHTLFWFMATAIQMKCSANLMAMSLRKSSWVANSTAISNIFCENTHDPGRSISLLK